MPVRQVLTESESPVGTALGQPAEGLDLIGRQHEALRDASGPVLVVAAATAFEIEQPAGNIRVIKLAGVLVFQLDHAA